MKALAELLGPTWANVVAVVFVITLVSGLQVLLRALGRSTNSAPEPSPEELEAERALTLRLLSLETPLTIAGLVLLPLVTHFGYEALVRAAVPETQIVLVQGSQVLLTHALAGAFLGLMITNWIVLRQLGARARALSKEIEARKHGALGRAIHERTGLITLALFLVPLALAVNEYTTVDERSVEIYAGFPSNRHQLPHTEVRRILQVRTTTLSGKLNSPSYYVSYADGTTLSSRRPLEDPLNDLVGSESDVEAAISLIVKSSGVPLEEVTLPFKTELPGVTDLEHYGYLPGS